MKLFKPPLTIIELPGGYRITDALGVTIALIYSQEHSTTASFMRQPTHERAEALAQAIVDALTEVFEEEAIGNPATD